MRVLLTGASGFVGSYVLRELVGSGHEAAVLLRDPGSAWRVSDLLGRVTVIRGGLDLSAEARGAALAFRPEAVVHLAWGGVAGRHRNDRAQLGNVAATLDLVDLARDAGAGHWVGLGSQAEYGPSEGPLAEDAPTRPTTLYGVAKLAAGLAAAQVCREAGLRFAWLRLFSAYGPKDDPAWMLPSLILRLLSGERPALTPGTQLWDYLYIDDAARAVALVATTPEAAGLFNLGSGRPVTIRSVVERVRELVDPSLPLGFGEVPFRPDQVMHLEADISRLHEATGWTPEVDLAEGLRSTVDWFRGKQPS